MSLQFHMSEHQPFLLFPVLHMLFLWLLSGQRSWRTITFKDPFFIGWAKAICVWWCCYRSSLRGCEPGGYRGKHSGRNGCGGGKKERHDLFLEAEKTLMEHRLKTNAAKAAEAARDDAARRATPHGSSIPARPSAFGPNGFMAVGEAHEKSWSLQPSLGVH